MRNSFLWAVAGATVILTGCQQNSVMGQRRAIPAPADDAQAVEESVKPMTPAASAASAETVKPAAPAYEPMSGVKSSGGFDTVAAGTAVSTGKSGTYIVKSGDTPARIARKCKVRVSALMAANNLDDAAARKLKVGQKLIIPSGKYVAPVSAKKSVKKSTAANKTATAAADTASVGADGKYVVKPGDTPERIARRHKVKLSELLAVNNLTEASARKLQIGQKLVIPGKGGAAAAPAPAAAAVENASAAPVVPAVSADSGVTADVSAADAAGAGTEEPAVVSDSSSDVEAVEVTADMTLADFAAKQGVTVEVLRGLNHDKGDKLVKGDWIFVPSKK